MNVEFLVKVAEKLDVTQSPSAVVAANAIDMALEMAADHNEDVYLDALGNLTIFATWLDMDNHRRSVKILDTVLEKSAEFISKTAAKEKTQVGLLPAKDLYDYKAHREESLFGALKDEHAKAREPNMDTWKGGGHPLLTRYSPDYPGVMMYRVSDGVYQDLLSKKVYDFKNGFISDTGIRYFGGSVAYQTPSVGQYLNSPQIMESRHLRTRPQ